MQNAVMAIWHHSKSTDEETDHDVCPLGEESLCCFQRDISKGKVDMSMNHPFQKLLLMQFIQRWRH